MIKKKYNFLILGIVVSVILGVVVSIGFDTTTKADTEIESIKIPTEIIQEPTTQINPSSIQKNLDSHATGPMSAEQISYNEKNSELGSKIVQDCGREMDCVHQYMKEISQTESKAVVMLVLDKVIQEWEKEKFPCHHDAHHMGRFVLGLYDGNLVEAISNIEHNLCGNALYHGILENYLPVLVLLEDIPVEDLDIYTPCKELDSTESSNAFRQCVHGMGHGLLKVYNYDTFEAVERCQVFQVSGERAHWECYDGLFMENHNQYFDQTGLGDYMEDDVLYPCDFHDEKYQPMCYQYQGNIILAKNNYDYQRTFQICEGLPSDESQRACIRTVSQYMTDYFFSEDFEKIVEMCTDENTIHPDSCIGSAVYSLTLYGDANPMEVLCPLFQGEFAIYCENYYNYVLEDNDLV